MQEKFLFLIFCYYLWINNYKIMEIQFHDITLLDEGVIVNYLLHDDHGTADVTHILKKSSLSTYIKEHRLNIISDGMDDEAELDLETYYLENYYEVAKAFVKWNIQNT